MMIAFAARIFVLALGIPFGLTLSGDTLTCITECTSKIPATFLCNRNFFFAACENGDWDKMKQCVIGCPEGVGKQEEIAARENVLKFCERADIIKQRHSYKKHTACVESICHNVDSQCGIPCNGVQLMLFPHNFAAAAATENPGRILYKLFTDSCRDMACFQKCGGKNVTQKCGSGSDAALTYYAEDIVGTLKMIPLPKQDWPAECKTLAGISGKVEKSVITIFGGILVIFTYYASVLLN